MLQSSLNINKMTHSPLPDFLQFTEEDNIKFNKAGIQPSGIDQIESENESYQPEVVTEQKI